MTRIFRIGFSLLFSLLCCLSYDRFSQIKFRACGPRVAIRWTNNVIAGACQVECSSWFVFMVIFLSVLPMATKCLQTFRNRCCKEAKPQSLQIEGSYDDFVCVENVSQSNDDSLSFLFSNSRFASDSFYSLFLFSLTFVVVAYLTLSLPNYSNECKRKLFNVRRA